MESPRRAPGSSELPVPHVPSPEAGRAGLWALLALMVLGSLVRPGDPPPTEVLRTPRGCGLAAAGSGVSCPCDELSGKLRRLLGLPIPLNRAEALDLEALPGIGPARARAIVAERVRAGDFETPEDLVRVHGLGPATVARIRAGLFVKGPDPACGSQPHEPSPGSR